MKRRNFLIGVSGTAIGGSALLGSGAFTRVESQRRVKIEVAEDPDAYLGLDGCPDSANSSYTNIDESGHLEVDMSPSNPTDAGGQGVNSDSFTYFDDVFQICNQGKQPVAVWIEATAAFDLEEPYAEYDSVSFYVGDDDTRMIDADNPELLQVGDCLCVGIRTVTKGLEEGDQLLEDDEIVVHADADTAANPPQGGAVWNQTQGTTYDTIQAAEDDANEGDTIKVYPTNNPYEEMVEVDTDELTIVGINRPLIRAPDYGGPGGVPIMDVSASGVEIRGMEVDQRGIGGNVPRGINLGGDDGAAINNVVRYSDPGGTGQPAIGGGGDGVRYGNNYVSDGAMAYGGDGDATVLDNQVVGDVLDEAFWSGWPETPNDLVIEGNDFSGATTGETTVKIVTEPNSVNGETAAQGIAGSICDENVGVVDVNLEWDDIYVCAENESD